MKIPYLLFGWLLFSFFVLPLEGYSQSRPVLQAGPVLGYVEHREALVWIQTNVPSSVFIEYWESGKDNSKVRSQKIYTTALSHCTGKLLLEEVDPGKTYFYEIFVNNKKQKSLFPYRFTTQSIPSKRGLSQGFTVAAGSCSFIYDQKFDPGLQNPNTDYTIYQSIADKDPKAMLWLGDNVYLRSADYTSRTGFYKRYSYDRQEPALRHLMAKTSNYAIWDDHDFGPNDISGFYPLKNIALDAFIDFWPNPGFGVYDMPGITTSFQLNGVDFFLLDNRYYRTEQYSDGSGNILGYHQINWLIEALKYSKSPFKIIAIGGQVLNSAKVYENYSLYSDELEYLLGRINDENIKGVVFLSGDRHHGEVSSLDLPNGNKIYEITTSPLTGRVSTVADSELNENRLEGSLVVQRNFALLKFEERENNPQLTIELCDEQGAVLFTHSVQHP
jgi:alkaline phosphatase D